MTFKQIDPFFVVDLSDPENIAVLGELKIPGFSRYLHPYDDSIILGLGRSTDDNGRQQGIKISLFNVSDPANPEEIISYEEDETHSSSIAEFDHHAFLFSKEKDLLVIPIRSYDRKKPFSGVMVFNITKNSIELKGIIEHSSSGFNSGIQRSLYIDDLLYTKSEGYLMINNLSTLDEINTVVLANARKYPPETIL